MGVLQRAWTCLKVWTQNICCHVKDANPQAPPIPRFFFPLWLQLKQWVMAHGYLQCKKQKTPTKTNQNRIISHLCSFPSAHLRILLLTLLCWILLLRFIFGFIKIVWNSSKKKKISFTNGPALVLVCLFKWLSHRIQRFVWIYICDNEAEEEPNKCLLQNWMTLKGSKD